MDWGGASKPFGVPKLDSKHILKFYTNEVYDI
jgi:hypothetical protein